MSYRVHRSLAGEQGEQVVVEISFIIPGSICWGWAKLAVCDIEQEAKESVSRVGLAERESLGVVLMFWH